MPSPVVWEIRDAIAVVTLDTPDEKVNILNGPFMSALEDTLKGLSLVKGVSAIVLHSGKSAGFVAGADITAIEDVVDASVGEQLARQGQQLFQSWADLPIPVIAALHGHCLGGGCELALACDYRIGTDSLTIGLPEVKLGILPGWGGTQRLPRLVGLEKALDLILTGRTVRAKEAVACGLIDRLAPEEQLLEQALSMAREVVHSPQSARRSEPAGNRLRSWLLEQTAIGRTLLFKQVEKRLSSQTGGHYPAPFKALAVIRETVNTPLKGGLLTEAKALGELVVTRESKNLVHIFHLSQRPKKGIGVACEPRPVEQAAVLGAGVMGASIAWLLASNRIPVVLKDINDQAVERGLAHIRKLFTHKLAKRGGDKAVDEAMTLVTGTTDYDALDTTDLVIEAVLEQMAVKQNVLQEIEPHLADHTFFATNTSALSVSTLQGIASRPTQVAGMHFFNPVEKMPLVEVIRGTHTSDEAMATIFELARRLGKIPIVVADRPGFLVNRLLVTYLNEACQMVDEGCDWQSLDRQAKAFGMPMGPFRLIDEVGVDIAMEVGQTLTDSFAYLPKTDLLVKVHAAGLLGKKNGLGFYKYDNGRSSGTNQELASLLPTPKRRADPEDWERLLLVMVAEASRCLAEGVVIAPEDIDAGMVFGTGFPPFHGGLCRWSDQQYGDQLSAALRPLQNKFGERFQQQTLSPTFYPRP